jgi:hypothetical protein
MEFLHVYCNDVTDWFVAESAEEARQMGIKYNKDRFGGGDDYEEMEYHQVADNTHITINDDFYSKVITKTAADWCKANGKGFLCSTEY